MYSYRPNPVASTRVQGWGDEPCEPTVRMPDWSELAASYSRMKSAWGWANGGQPILVCYIRKYVIILAGIFPLTSPPTKILGGCVPGIPGGVDASASTHESIKNDCFTGGNLIYTYNRRCRLNVLLHWTSQCIWKSRSTEASHVLFLALCRFTHLL